MSQAVSANRRLRMLETKADELRQELRTTQEKLEHSQHSLLLMDSKLESARAEAISTELKYIREVQTSERLVAANVVLSQQLQKLEESKKIQTDDSSPRAELVDSGNYADYDEYDESWHLVPKKVLVDLDAKTDEGEACLVLVDNGNDANYDNYEELLLTESEPHNSANASSEITDTRKVGDLGVNGMPNWDIPLTLSEDSQGPSVQDAVEGHAGRGFTVGGIQTAAHGFKIGEKQVIAQDVVFRGTQSIAEGLKAAANEVLQESGVVYHEESGLYYDYDSGYYYDAERSLYYEPITGVYYVFDENTQQYKIHSQVDVSQQRRGSNSPREESTNGTRESCASKKEQVQLAVAHISDKKARARMAKRISRNLKREEKLKKLQGKMDKKSVIKRYNLMEAKLQSDIAEIKRRKRALDDLHEGHDGDGIEETQEPRMSSQEKNRPSNQDVSGLPDSKELGPGGNSNEDMVVDGAENSAHDDDDGGGDGETSPMQPKAAVAMADSQAEDGGGDAAYKEKQDSESELEEGQLPSSTEEDSATESECEEVGLDEGTETSSPPPEAETVPIHYPRCIRAMVTESDILDVATLFIVTYTGGTIGREPTLNHIIHIPEHNISKAHAGLQYRDDLKQYTISDFASQNGTFLNGHRLSEPKKMSVAFPVSHGDVLQVGSTKLTLHIHPGSETCDECEPGQVLAALQETDAKLRVREKFLTKDEKEKLRRKQLKQIKKKFGLEISSYVDNMDAINNPAYEDRASARRHLKGSDNPYQPDDEPSSVDRPIEDTNIGHKLLGKMGWKEGQGLGREEQGVSEPVQASLRALPKAGLGADAAPMSLNALSSSQAARNWARARQRYRQTQRQSPGAAGRKRTRDKSQTKWVKGTT